MTNATQKKRTWAGYACPVCRFVFRVPRDHDGVGVICPACRYLLNIPQKQKSEQQAAMDIKAPKSMPFEPRDKVEHKPIVSRPLTDADSLPSTDSVALAAPDSVPAPAKGARRRRKKQRSSESVPSWENQTSSSGAGKGGYLPWVIGGSLIGLGVIAVGAWLVLGAPDSNQRNDSPYSSSQLASWDEFEASGTEVEMTDEEQKKQKEIQDSVNTGMDVVKESEKVVKAFLTAETAEDLEKLIRTPDVTIPRMRKWYSNHKWVAPGVKEIGYGGGITVKGVMASMSVRVNDYSIKHIAVERTSDGYLIDWESWVAWTEMPWADLFKKRPTELVEVRVICMADSYYNRLFRDDSKWLAVRMNYPGADRSIYGYIDVKTSTLTSLLGDLKTGRPVPVTIKIRYPKDSVADNQVFIEEYVQNGWVRPPKDASDSSAAKDDTPPMNE